LIMREVMQSPVQVINRMDTLSHARKIMMKEHLSRLVVVEGTKPIGTLTRRDIVRDLNNYRMRQRELDSIIVDEVMKSPVATVSETDLLASVARKMVEGNVRGLPVVDPNGDLVGIITKTDLAQYFAENYGGRLRVSEVCQPKDKIAIAHLTDSISRVLDLMQECSADRIVVVDGKKPLGVITETDLTSMRPKWGAGNFVKVNTRGEESVSQARRYLVPTAEGAMTKNPVTVQSTMDASKAARVLLDKGIGGLPVVDGQGELVGLLTKFDLVKVIAKED